MGWFVKVYAIAHALTPYLVVFHMRKKMQHLPKSTQLASNELTFTYKLYYGFLLGVNFDIPTLTLNYYPDGWNADVLQNGTLFNRDWHTLYIVSYII